MRYSILLTLLFITLNLQANTELDDAYKREFIFLNSQLKELKKQESGLQEKFRIVKKQALKDLEDQQEKYIFLNAYNEKLNDRVYNLEKNVELNDENKTILQNTLKQAALNLNFEKVPDGVDLKNIFESSLRQLQMSSSKKKQKAAFYLENGKKVRGEILYIGRVASIGFYEGTYYMLAPAGGGDLKAWKEQPHGEAIFMGNFPQVSSLFVYESLDKGISQKKAQSIINFVDSGGAIAWVIVAMGMFALVLCVLRFIRLKTYAWETSFLEKNCQVSDLVKTKVAFSSGGPPKKPGRLQPEA
jgi:biopolymer transport protein ExbB